MNKNRLLSSLIAVMAVLAADAQNPAAPKLVVGILIDQLRSDYLQAFMPLYGEGGFMTRRTFTKRNYLLPINQEELNRVPGMTQNLGW